MKICFWGDIARALKDDTPGGGELQIALLAKTLTKSGHEVVVLDFSIAEDFITEDGIKVYRIRGWDDGIPVIRFLINRLPKLYSTLKNQRADIYYCRIRDFRHILAFRAARKVKGKFVLGLASDLDAMSFRKRLKFQYSVSQFALWSFFNGLLIEMIYPFLLKRADLVLVQHEEQKRILGKKNVKSVVFPNLIELDKLTLTSTHPDSFSYVGSIDKRKGFLKFVELIEKTPHLKYKVIGKPRDKVGSLQYERLKGFKNVTLLGKLNHSDTISQIADSKALVSTSPMEGFPNVFIEAWSCGIPVVSLYCDPGGTIEKNKLGVVCSGDLNKMKSVMEGLNNSAEFADRAKLYVNNNHLITGDRIKQINGVFNELYNKRDKSK